MSKNPTLRLLLTVARVLNLDVNELAEGMVSPKTTTYAKSLVKALDKGIKKGYERAVKDLQSSL